VDQVGIVDWGVDLMLYRIDQAKADKYLGFYLGYLLMHEMLVPVEATDRLCETHDAYMPPDAAVCNWSLWKTPCAMVDVVRLEEQ
jgi:hypothetical protein